MTQRSEEKKKHAPEGIRSEEDLKVGLRTERQRKREMSEEQAHKAGPDGLRQEREEKTSPDAIREESTYKRREEEARKAGPGELRKETEAKIRNEEEWKTAVLAPTDPGKIRDEKSTKATDLGKVRDEETTKATATVRDEERAKIGAASLRDEESVKAKNADREGITPQAPRSEEDEKTSRDAIRQEQAKKSG